MERQLVLGIDIGGTKIAGGLIDREGRVWWKERSPTEASRGRQAVLENIQALAARILEQNSSQNWGTVAGIGISTAGEVDPLRGRIISATDSLPGWTGTELKASCESHFGLITVVDNDGNATIIGEQYFGAGRDISDFVCVALGTGVGGGVVSNGHLVRGVMNMAGAFGHIPLVAGGRLCPCGNKGCLEAYVSGSAITSIAREVFQDHNHAEGASITSERLFSLAQEGDPTADHVVKLVADYLGCGLASIAQVLNPEIIIIAGGVAEAGEFLIEPSKESFRRHTLREIFDSTEIIVSPLRSDAGLLGAAALWWNRKDTEK